MADEKISLELEVRDESLKAARKTYVATTDDIYELADSYEMLEHAEQDAVKPIGPLISQSEALRKQLGLVTTTSHEAASGITKAGTAITTAGHAPRQGGMDIGNCSTRSTGRWKTFNTAWQASSITCLGS